MAQPRNPLEAAKALLLQGAEVVQALREGNPEALDKLEEYTERFDSWQKTWKRSSAGKAKFSGKDREIGERIARQHATVVELTEEMSRSLQDTIKDLRGWTKGIRAYMDHLPKRISTIRSQKG
jgi:hypothetical protein